MVVLIDEIDKMGRGYQVRLKESEQQIEREEREIGIYVWIDR